MNKKQLIAMWVGIIIIVIMVLFPPWHLPLRELGTQKRSGCAFILNPPHFGDGVYPMINVSQLCIQCFIVGLITTGYIITLKDDKPKDEQKQ
jgi:hypothetical protein